MSLFQSQKQKMEMKLSAELSFKIMQVGQLVFELKTDYIQFFDEDTRVKLLQVNEIIEELAQQMTGSTAERMYLWRVEKEEKKRLAQQESEQEKNDSDGQQNKQSSADETK
ncbi:MAG TPA: hypothetical protein PKN50_10730 [Spirochaetota bacterium]|nr:hypothetical protein [Spirochaetota bacterium]HPV43227.1 hypothetical protein [Spirochaetota bacterium]